MRKYVIPIKGLGLGKHEFNFKIDSRFFEYFENSEIKEGNLSGKVTVNKKPLVIELHFNIQGEVNITCDRCLEYFNFPVQYTGTVFAKFGEDSEELTDDMIFLSPKDHEINISQFFYDFICLSLPYKRIHPNGKNGKSLCNEEMLNKLNKFLIRQENIIDADPRWAPLKKIKLFDNGTSKKKNIQAKKK
ncbi:MAG: DUF177 domain-containing protein [Bacteroidales bacterium]|nr:DUF177 domain-containing protein [Bacteroidales bacterium]